MKKNIKHLKNQKDIGFIALVVSENIEINESGEKNIFWIIFKIDDFVSASFTLTDT